MSSPTERCPSTVDSLRNELGVFALLQRPSATVKLKQGHRVATHTYHAFLTAIAAAREQQ